MSEDPNVSGFSASEFLAEKRKRYPFRGPVGRIRFEVQKNNLKKWGFLMYRCDYSDDDAWKKFVYNIRYEMEQQLKILNAEDLKDTLNMTVKEDKTVLDGATIDQVRKIFGDWINSEEARTENVGSSDIARYNYCVHVDADAIESVVNRAPQPPELDKEQVGYVNLLRLVWWETEKKDNRYPLDEEEEEEEEFDDDEDFGKMNDVKVPISYLGPESYASFNPAQDQTWELYVRDRRADGVSCGQDLGIPRFGDN